MEIDELAMRLGALEQAQQQAQETAFMDKYGTRFNNNPDLGVAILGELNRRGVDVSAADDAVQGILDQLRMELTQAMDAVQQMMSDLSTTMDKVNTIDEAVVAASGQANPTQYIPDVPDMPPVEQPPVEEAPAPAEQAPVEETQPPVEEAPAPAEETQLPAPNTTVSDAREKVVQKPVSNKRSWSSGMIAAARGI